MVRQILHVDLDAFFVSVEQLFNPSLKGKPVIVGGDPSSRGVVASASYEARAYGVHSAMPLVKAQHLCPEAIFLKANFSHYIDISNRFRQILMYYTPKVEPAGIDEAYLDITGWHEDTALRLAENIKNHIESELHINATIGIATCKLVAKVASEMAKPNGILEVVGGEERTFLEPLLVNKLPGVGKKTKKIFHQMGIYTIGQLASTPPGILKNTFGISGEILYYHANGIDHSKVEPPSPTKSISHEITFSEDTLDLYHIEALLRYLSEKIATELRRLNKQARCVTLKLRYSDFKTITRSLTLKTADSSDQVIYDAGMESLNKALAQQYKPIRLIGIKVSSFTGPERQLSMLDYSTGKFANISRAIDRIRERHGSHLIQTGITHPLYQRTQHRNTLR
jgi:DNA polymerase-4